MPHDDQEIMMTLQPEATAIHAIPAQWLERGFRLLVLRVARQSGWECGDKEDGFEAVAAR